jgi:hypothetical protein
MVAWWGVGTIIAKGPNSMVGNRLEPDASNGPFISPDCIAAIRSAVIVAPEITALTRMPRSPNSTAIEWVTAIRPALAAPWVASRQRINSTGPIGGAGLRYLPVEHTGNQNCSPEETWAACELVNAILTADATWIDSTGKEAPATLDHRPHRQRGYCR